MSSSSPWIPFLASLSAAALMIFSGVQKRLLDWRDARTCVSCGRKVDRCRCCR
jgi:hypothetical protein